MPNDPAPRAPTQPADIERRLRRMRRLANAMDAAYRIPGTRFRVGWDSIIGLAPGIGDAVTAGAGIYLLWQARQLGLGRRTQAAIIANTVIDFAVGSVPIAGDLFDAAWKSNRRNVRLIEQALARRAAAPPARPALGRPLARRSSPSA